MTAVKNLLNIRNFKGLTQLSTDFAEKQWNLLESDIKKILNGEKLTKTYEEIYRIAEDLYRYRENNKCCVTNNLRILIETDLLEKLYKLQDLDDELLTEINTLWTNFCDRIKIIKNLFIFFERSMDLQLKNHIQNESLTIFKNTIVLNGKVREKLVKNTLKYIDLERNGKEIDVKLMKNIIKMLENLQIYHDVFHDEFEKFSDLFYTNESREKLKYYSIIEYLKYVNQRLDEEEIRADTYLNKRKNAVKIVEVRMINDHVEEILDQGFEKLINNENFEDLTLLYALISRVQNENGLKKFSNYYVRYLTKIGREIMLLPDVKIVDTLLKFKRKLLEIIRDCFENNVVLQNDLRRTFSNFINVQPYRPAQLLAKYVDLKLRNKKLEHEVLEESFDDIVALFRLIESKDIFEAFYKKHLAKRLLLNKSTSQDAESSLVTKLRFECGSNFTSKIEAMFNDINISSAINSNFREFLKKYQTPDLYVNVLTNSVWPTYQNYNVNLPPQFIEYENIFEKFYAQNHAGRKLLWQPNLSHCLVFAHFIKPKELQLSFFQTIILQLFNTNVKLTYKEIKEYTNLEEKELKRTLISLTCGKIRIILKKPKGLNILNDTKFQVNENFENPLFRIKINEIQQNDTKEEEQATKRSVLIDRQFQIDAAIVRIMKIYRTITRSNLISELCAKLDIPMKIADLEKRIEMLIEREYMEIDKENPTTYNYIA